MLAGREGAGGRLVRSRGATSAHQASSCRNRGAGDRSHVHHAAGRAARLAPQRPGLLSLSAQCHLLSDRRASEDNPEEARVITLVFMTSRGRRVRVNGLKGASRTSRVRPSSESEKGTFQHRETAQCPRDKLVSGLDLNAGALPCTEPQAQSRLAAGVTVESGVTWNLG